MQRHLPAAAALLLALTALMPPAAHGQATPYVPNLDPAYGRLDALVAARLP